MFLLRASPKSNQSKSNPRQEKGLTFLAILPTTLTAVLGQWLYFFHLNNSWFPGIFASFTFFVLSLLPLVALTWNSSIEYLTRDNSVRKIASALFLLAATTVPASIISYLNFSNSYYLIEGLKAAIAFLSGLFLILLLGPRIKLALNYVFIIYSILIFFGLGQLLIGINYATSENLLTLGVSNRWWDYNALWGPMAFTGKNAYAVSIVLCLCVILPLLSSNCLQRRTKKLLTLSIPLSLICIYYSKSRIALLLAIIFLFTEFISRPKEKNKHVAVFLVLYSLVSVLLILWIRTGFDFFDSWIFDARSITARRLSLEATFTSTENNFVWGVGYNGIFQVTASTFGNSLSTANQNLGLNVDNFFVRRLVETGFLGTFPFLFFLWALFNKSSASRNGEIPSQRQSWLRSLKYLGVCLIFSSLTGDYLSNLNVIAIMSVMLSAICVGLNSSVER